MNNLWNIPLFRSFSWRIFVRDFLVFTILNQDLPSLKWRVHNAYSYSIIKWRDRINLFFESDCIFFTFFARQNRVKQLRLSFEVALTINRCWNLKKWRKKKEISKIKFYINLKTSFFFFKVLIIFSYVCDALETTIVNMFCKCNILIKSSKFRFRLKNFCFDYGKHSYGNEVCHLSNQIAFNFQEFTQLFLDILL